MKVAFDTLQLYEDVRDAIRSFSEDVFHFVYPTRKSVNYTAVQEICISEIWKLSNLHTPAIISKESATMGHRGGGGVDDGGNYGPDSEEKINKSGKKQWGFNGLTKWKRDETEDETAPLDLHERWDSEAFWGSSKFNSDCNESNWEGSQH
ncbi:hypothetical protein SDJN03_16420, partial [Cucurbita argyrosperma subsp. sororia]